MNQPGELVVAEQQSVAVAPVEPYLSVAEVVERVAKVRAIMSRVMEEGVHYGRIPGMPDTAKPCLFKPGGELLCMTFRIAPKYDIDDLSTDDAFRYRVLCSGYSQVTGQHLGDGLGECSSNEEKYKWRKAGGDKEYTNAELVGRARMKYGYNRQDRREYSIKQVRTDPADISNTILKMAAKRAFMAMVISVTAAGDVVTQDLEDMTEELREQLASEPQERAATKTVEQPTGKGDKAAPPSDKPASQLLNPQQQKILTAQLEHAALSTGDLEKKWGPLAELTLDKFNAVTEWIRSPS